MSRENNVSAIVESLIRLQRPAFNTNLKQVGLSHAQVGMLFLLSRHPQKSVKEIAEYLGISKSAITQLADPLADKQLISRRNDEQDRRIVRMSLTDGGHKVMRKLAHEKFDGIRTAIGNLSDPEVESLYKLIIKMSKN